MAKSIVNCCLGKHDSDTHMAYYTYQVVNYGVPILKVLGIDVCAAAILEYVPIRELVRSERVCRRWQSAIHEYMHSIHTVSLYDLYDTDSLSLAKYGSNDKTDSCSHHRRIQISADTCSVSFACAIIEKWGCSIVNVFTSRQEDEYFELLMAKCSYLHCIKFVGQRKRKHFINQIFLSKQSMKRINFPLIQISKCKQLKKIGFKNIFDLRDDDMAILLRFIDFEELEIFNIPIKGDCLQSIKPNSLKSLHISRMLMNFDLYELLRTAKRMPNLKSLTLDNNHLAIFTHINLIVNEMPKLENLSLCDYYYDRSELGWDNDYQSTGIIESLSQLKNLKRLYLRGNEAVDDEMLEALANCRNLEYLDISNDIGKYTFWRVRNLTALFGRPRPAVTTLCLGYIQNFTSDLLSCVRNIKFPIVQNLEMMGYVEFTPQWLEKASEFSMMGRHPLEVEVITMPALTDEFHPNLKIVLSVALHN